VLGTSADLFGDEVPFQRLELATLHENNGGFAAVANINGDRTPDIVAGLQWFEGPSWVRHQIFPVGDSIIDTGKTIPYDLDGDGDLDVIGNRRPAELFWWENPGPPSTGTWIKHHITSDVTYPEILRFVDIDDDGADEMLLADDGEQEGIRAYEIPDNPQVADWPYTPVEPSSVRHGLGVGDLNEDRLLDIVSDFVWYEQEEDGSWTRHDFPDKPSSADGGHHTMQISVYDVDADGDNDVILNRCHNYGMYWYESTGGTNPTFVRHEILEGQLPSQMHSPTYGDIDGDGDEDIFAGKSKYHHGDPGESDPYDVFWIELVRTEGSVSWIKHHLADDFAFGFGPAIGDVDADGDADLIVRVLGLGGTYMYEPPPNEDLIIFRNDSTPVDTTPPAAPTGLRIY
jgi:hypothetical protein